MSEGVWKLKIEDEGFQDFLRKLSAEDLYKIEKSIGLEMAEVARDHLEEHRTPEGKQMKPWSSRYAKTVRDRGEKRDILLGPERRLHRSMSFSVDSDGIYYGSNMVYAAVHQWGWEERNIPRRPYLGMGSEEKKGIEDVINDFIGRMIT